MAETVFVNTGGIGGALLLLWFLRHRAGSSSTFAHLFSLLWGPCILAAQFYTTSTETVSTKTLVVLFAAWWALLGGTLLTTKKQPAVAPCDSAINRRRALTALLILFSAQAALVAYEMPSNFSKDSPDKLIVDLRTKNLASSTDWNKCPWWLEIFRGAYCVYLPLALILRKRNWLSKRAFVALFLAACLLSLSRMTRMPLLNTMVTMWASWLILNRRRILWAWGMLIGGLAVVGSVFLVIQSALQSKLSVSTGTTGLVEAYFGGSMRAFDSIIDGTFPRSPGYYSADGIYYVLHKLNLIDSYPSIVRPYGNYNTNIYTFLDGFTLDAGVFGALLGAAIVGVVGGWVFTRASRVHNPIMLTASALFAIAMVDAVANNDFIRINFVMNFCLGLVVNRLVVQRNAKSRVVYMRTAHGQSLNRRLLSPGLRRSESCASAI